MGILQINIAVVHDYITAGDRSKPGEYGYINLIMTITDYIIAILNRADCRLAPSEWETSLQSNAVSHCLGANLESALSKTRPNKAVCIFNGSYCKYKSRAQDEGLLEP